MSTYTGKQYPGAARTIRELKRREAGERNANTPHEKTRAHREGRCGVAEHEAAVRA